MSVLAHLLTSLQVAYTVLLALLSLPANVTHHHSPLLKQFNMLIRKAMMYTFMSQSLYKKAKRNTSSRSLLRMKLE